MEITLHGIVDGELRSITVSTRTDERATFWVENEAGEGMSMSEQNLFDVLREHFEANF